MALPARLTAVMAEEKLVTLGHGVDILGLVASENITFRRGAAWL